MGTPHLPSVRTTVLTGIGMKSLLLLSLVCFAAGQDVPRKIRDQMAQWNFQERCWGYETMTQISLQLFKAQEYCNTLAPLHSMDHSTMTKPNMQQYTEGWWEGVDYDNEHIATSDPEWKEMMINSYQDCHDIAEAWPQESLDRNVLTKKYGRNMIFFRCAKKSENLNCGKWQILKGLEVWYGQASEEDRQRMTAIGLPANKYDAAVVSMMVLYDAVTPEEEFVNDFFWGKHDL